MRRPDLTERLGEERPKKVRLFRVGDVTKTRCGVDARVIYVNLKSHHSLAAAFIDDEGEERLLMCDKDGRCMDVDFLWGLMPMHEEGVNYEELRAAYERRSQQLLDCATLLAQYGRELDDLRELRKAVLNPPHLLFGENHSYVYRDPEIARGDRAREIWEAWWKDLFDRFGGHSG